jgi:hypothetical protein
MERLTAEDLVLLWPDERWPQEIGCLAVLDGGGLLDADGYFLIEKVRAAIAGRLHLLPRFRQLLYRPRLGLGPPLWVDSPAFDLNDHLGVLPLPAAADETQLLRAAERVVARRLDRSRPLWEMWFIPGLPESDRLVDQDAPRDGGRHCWVGHTRSFLRSDTWRTRRTKSSLDPGSTAAGA